MRHPLSYFFQATLFTFLIFEVWTDDIPTTDKTIISQWPSTIQLISLSPYAHWPNSVGSLPLDIWINDGRLTLVWPKSLISLNTWGQADINTILTLFATTRTDGNGALWNPEDGSLSPDGFWRSIDSDGALLELNLSTGVLERHPLEGGIQGPVYPAFDGTLVAQGPMGPVIISNKGSTGFCQTIKIRKTLCLPFP